MAVTTQTYTATATWTASTLANTFRSAFIDAGLMTEWYDSFLSGTVENRILEVVNDAGKTYGTVYYWFMFTTGGVFLHTALSWNAGSDIPSGTQYQNFFATTTNATTNHRQLITLTSATTCTVTRYTSAINTDCTFFTIRNGTTNSTFLVPKGNFNVTSFVNQNTFAFNSIINAYINESGNIAVLGFRHVSGHTRRTYLGASACRGSTSNAVYSWAPLFSQYAASGNVNNNSANYSFFLSNSSIILPTAFTNTHTGLGSDVTPVFTSISIAPYLPVLPSDFGIAAYYASNAMTVQDTLVVSSGTEEWEMLTVSNNALATETSKLLFLARTVG